MGGEYYVLDFKTTTWPSRATNEKYRMSHQISGYVYGAKALLDLRIRGAIIDQVALNQKIVPERDFVRVMTQRTDAQLEEWRQQTIRAVWAYRESQRTGVFDQYTDSCN